MPYKNPEQQQAAQRAYYERNKEASLASSRKSRESRKAAINAAKNCPCVDCGQPYPPRVMHFHHRDPAVKEGIISEMIKHASLGRILEEIAKCDVLCANCHALRH